VQGSTQITRHRFPQRSVIARRTACSRLSLPGSQSKSRVASAHRIPRLIRLTPSRWIGKVTIQTNNHAAKNPFVGVELLQILQGDVVLALVLAKAHQIDTLLGDKLFDACHEGHGLGRHGRGRGEALTEMPTQVPHHAAYALQLWHVHVQVHPIDALALEHDVSPQNFAHTL
jgi:hypothetical protein